jgi:LmbE family N-acetylglucosaminyl deacetylase
VAVTGCRPPPAPPAPPVDPSAAVPTTRALVLPPEARVLVFAPHPDDEVLGAGGLVARVTAARRPVRIVFFTNGDGYREAIVGSDAQRTPRERDYLALGRERQREALAAARRLGVPPAAVRFLGYPDDGLAPLWEAHWTTPYTSPHTRQAAARYPHLLLPGAAYDGAELRWLVERVLVRFEPNVVVFPHPADTHPDHRHAGYFVLDAVSALQARRRLAPGTMLLAYVVHHPSWPLRRGPAHERCVPDPRIGETTWTALELSPGELEAKREALDAHRTQVGVMGGFLREFLCANELFGILDHELVGRIAAVH